VLLSEGEYFGLPMRQFVINGLTLALSRYTHLERQPWHTHENPTLFLLMQGVARDRLRREEAEVGALTLVYHPIDVPHRSEAGLRGMLCLNIEPSLVWLSAHQLSPDDLGPYATLQCPTARLAALRMLLQAFTSSQPLPADLENDAFEVIAPLISPQRLSCPEPRPPHWLLRAQAFLRESLTETVSLRDAACEADVHPVHLARVFRAHYGCSVGEYVRRMRLLRAASHVLQQQSSLCTAAHDAGFADQAHFTRLFAREVGLCPKALLRLRASV
jgi:AraC family transcriptional regulator